MLTLLLDFSSDCTLLTRSPICMCLHPISRLVVLCTATCFQNCSAIIHHLLTAPSDVNRRLNNVNQRQTRANNIVLDVVDAVLCLRNFAVSVAGCFPPYISFTSHASTSSGYNVRAGVGKGVRQDMGGSWWKQLEARNGFRTKSRLRVGGQGGIWVGTEGIPSVCPALPIHPQP